MTNVSKLPTPGVVLDLDAYERPENEVKPPFIVKVAGRLVTFADPMDIDWRDLAVVEAPGDILRAALSREDREHITNQKILPTFKFSKLIQDYYTYYDLEDKINEAKRQKAFSS